jgi:hypothetical protein
VGQAVRDEFTGDFVRAVEFLMRAYDAIDSAELPIRNQTHSYLKKKGRDHR